MIPASLIKKAKYADLPSVVSSLGFKLCREGQSFSSREHDSLKLFKRQGIWLYKWWSRNGEVGDGIQFLRRFFGMEFHDAVAALSGEITGCSYNTGSYESPHHDSETYTSIHWQKKAERLAGYAKKNLFEASGSKCLEFLIRERGLNEHTVKNHCLGWLPERNYMPSKLVIPCFNIRGQLIRIRFRIDNPRPNQARYRVMKGSNTHSSFSSGIFPGKPVVVVESELDGILVHQGAGSKTGVLALGTTANSLSEPVFKYFANKIPLALVSLDNDRSGKEKTRYFLERIPNSLSWPVPGKTGKDPGEAWKKISIREWIAEAIASKSSAICQKPVSAFDEVRRK